MKRKAWMLLAVCIAFAVATLFTNHAQGSVAPGTILQTFTSPDRPNSQNAFGVAFASFQDTLFISDPSTPDGGTIYQLSQSGSLIKKIKYPGQWKSGFFGESIRVVGNHLVVGDMRDGLHGDGRVFIFDAITGALQNELAPSGLARDFGRSLASAGNQLMIGNSGTNVPAFDVDTGKYVRQFEMPPGSNLFGWDLAVHDSRLYVSDPGAPHGSGHGRISVFDVATGALVRSIGDTWNIADSLGTSITFVNGQLLVGDPNFAYGEAFLFDPTNGRLVRLLEPPENARGVDFGIQVSGIGPYSIVATRTFQKPGSLYFYDSNGGLALTIDPPIPLRGFGSLAPWGDNLLVSSADESGNSGIVYLFSTPVPEPALAPLLISGVIACVLFSTFRRGRLSKKPRSTPAASTI